MVIILQIVGVSFVLFMFYICFSHYRRKEFCLSDFILWTVLWSILLFLMLFPRQYEFLFGGLSVQGALQFIILLSIGILYCISFFTYTRSRRNEAKIQALVSQIAVYESQEKESVHKPSEGNGHA